jgi:hypothetical protein
MFCPQCGQQQVSDVTRFCSRCGFPLDGVTAVLSTGGAVPSQLVQPVGYKQLSPRSKGVRQGAVLMLSTFLVVPVMAILTATIFQGIGHIVVPLAAIICFVGGILRMLYALLMEDAYPQAGGDAGAHYPAPGGHQFDRPPHHAALPPNANPAGSWRPRPNTAEIYQPPSVTESTTRLLDKEERKNRQ